jgi:hypothetical protein
MAKPATTIDAIHSYTDIMEANAQLMTEIYTDPKLTAAEKMKSFATGVRNQVGLSRDLAARRAELLRYGIKESSEVKGLTFNPMADAT